MKEQKLGLEPEEVLRPIFLSSQQLLKNAQKPKFPTNILIIIHPTTIHVHSGQDDL